MQRFSWPLPVFSVRPARGADEVERRVQKLDLKPAERNWERIGWLTDMKRATELAKQTHRPIFVLAAEGNLDGRC